MIKTAVIPSLWMTFLVIWIAFGIEQMDFGLLFPAYSLLFAGYVWIAASPGKKHTSFFLALAVFLRLLLLFAFPNLSDDVYRFIWDGRLIAAGYNPFGYLPRDLVEQPPPDFLPDRELFELLNSPDYFTVYPPLAQGVFAFAAYIFPEDIYWSAFLMKVPLIALDIGNVWLIMGLLKWLDRPVSSVLWYALNPLILLEISGNLHFEGVMLFFFLLSWLALLQGRQLPAMVAFGLSVASKLLTLLFVPAMFRRFPEGARIRTLFFLSIITGLLFLPFFNLTFLSNLGQSLDLYFRSFEFNASLYYLLRSVGYVMSGYNRIGVIGPGLSLVFVLLLVLLVWRERKPDWQNWFVPVVLIQTLYLFFSTTIHPWYLSFLIAGLPFTGFRYPLVWSYLVYLSYFAYSREPFAESGLLLSLEYGIVIPLMLVEWYRSARGMGIAPVRQKSKQ